MPVTSSVLVSIGYDAASAVLEAEFQSGAVYRYFLVPPRVFRELRGAATSGASVGAAFNELVKAAGYRFEEL
ncbi:KTSC domain-containing protein [Agrococcus sp. HG114]|uniref:KTSC domain-containing protein n=1 Tax=Agrococcus sp. HG114 TaxID=2969757 RepID=UPI00215AD23B|nr:KTSC domain-containing protein [Agrococcus sp. HG114]MCR8671515.1 KTSC domain-containing protein [Agrococcus sp. HG114]